MRSKKRYKLDRVSVTPATSRPASWTFAGDAVRGTEHTYLFDVVGRQTEDRVTILGPAINGAVLRLATAYDTAGISPAALVYTLPNFVNVDSEDFDDLPPVER